MSTTAPLASAPLAPSCPPVPAAFDPAVLADPTCVGLGRLAAHSDHLWFASAEEAEAALTAAAAGAGLSGLGAPSSSFQVCLDGTWKMSYAPCPAQAPEGFWEEDADVSTWDDVPVPAHVQTLGYDLPQYANTQYPWDGREPLEPGQVPTAFNPVASYVRTFELPQALPAGERLVLRLEGAESAVAAWVNGVFVGYSEDTFTPTELDVTAAVRAGTNRLALRVWRWCSGSWLEDQDFYRFSGLFRSVYLRRLPATHLADLRVGVSLSEDLTHAEVRLRTRLEGEGSVRAVLGGVGPLAPVPAGEAAGQDGADGTGLASIEVDHPHLWSAEDPHLYRLLIEVLDADGQVVEVVPQTVGIRRFGIEGGLLRINGRRVVLKGVNRHEFGPAGRVMTWQRTWEDLVALKRANVNAIRTSHYPNNTFLYDLTDRLGFYVIDEANLESHSMWDQVRNGDLPLEEVVPGDQQRWRPAVLDRARSMYERDKNHPSIVMWSCGNESYGGDVIADEADLLRSLDSRPVHYEGVDWDPRRPETSDVRTRMYTPAEQVAAELAGQPGVHAVTGADGAPGGLEGRGHKPFILCEYAHAMGNSFGAVDRYLELAEREPLFQGGFIWDFADQAVRLTAPDGRRYWGYGGDAGEAPHDGDFCGNGIFYADHTPSPKIQEVTHLYQPLHATLLDDAARTLPRDLTVGRAAAGWAPAAGEPAGLPARVRVVNRYLFTGSEALECRVVLEREGRAVVRATLDTEVAAGGQADYDLPEEITDALRLADGGEYALTVSFHLRQDTCWAPAGLEVAFDQTVLTLPGRPAAGAEPGAEAGVGAGAGFAVVPSLPLPAPLEVVEGGHNVGVRNATVEVLFSRLTGALTSLRYGRAGAGGGNQLLVAPVRPCFWHAPTANERGYGGPFEEGAWRTASLDLRPVREGRVPAVRRVGDDGEEVEVRFDYELAGLPGSRCSMTYRVTPDGEVHLTQRLEPAGQVPDLPEMSVLVEVPGTMDRLTYYGEGPQECYLDRRGGARLGVYSARVGEDLPGYLVPQESGSRTGVRWAQVRDQRGAGLAVQAPAGRSLEVSVLPWTPFEMEAARHPWELPVTGRTVLRASLMRRGVAGDDSWGARPQPGYRLPSSPLELEVTLRGVMEVAGVGGIDL